LYLAGLVVCAGCGRLMIARKDRRGDYCGAWDHHRTRGTLAESPCLRHGGRQGVLGEDAPPLPGEAGRRLDLLTRGDLGHLPAHLEGQELDAWRAFREGIIRLTAYLAEHHPEDYNALLRAQEEAAAVEVAEGAYVPGTLARMHGAELVEAHRLTKDR